MALLGPLNPLELARSARGVVAAATHRLRPDHLAIRQRAVQWYVGAPMTHCFLYAVVAPSRFSPRSFDDGQVTRARAFVAEARSGVFPEKPAWADDRYTLFAVEGDDGVRTHQLYVHRTGLVELLWALAPEELEGDPPGLLLDAREMTRVVGQLASAVAGDAYAAVSCAGRGRRRFARLDWWFQLGVSMPGDNGARHWTGLRFAEAEPPRAAHRWPAAPQDGYAAEELSSVRRRKQPAEVAQTFLTGVVKANGYYDFTTAVKQTVARELADS